MKIKIFKLLALFAVIAISSCKKDSTTSTSSYPMEMRMTDASGPYDAVYIDIQSVQVNTDPNGADNGWQTLNTKVGIYNLMTLTNGIDTFLASGNLPSGNISQVRLVLGNNNSVVVNGTTYSLKTPSAQQSGLKIQVHYTLLAGINYVVLLDFDAGKSIVSQGNGNYSLKPVIRACTSATTGAIKGVVTPVSYHPTIYAISGTDSVSTYCDTYGNFMIKGLSTGSYNVAFVPIAPYPVKVITGVSVTVGAVTNMGTIIIP